MSGFLVDHDHRIAPDGDDVMHLYDKQGNVLVTAERDGEAWTVTSPTTDDTQHPDRASALEAMWKNHAYTHLGPSGDNGEGYSTLIPHGLAETP